MNIIKITTQAEFAALPYKFEEYTEISVIGSLELIDKSRDNSHINVRGSAVINYVRGSAVINYVRGSAVINYVGGSAVISCVGDSAVINYVRDSAVINYVGGSAVITVISSDVIIGGLFMWATLIMKFCVCKVVKKHKTAQIVKHKRTKITNALFCNTLEKVKEGYILFKSVNPATLCDFQTGKIKYEGMVTCPDWDKDPNRECGGGLHLSPTPGMALSYHTGTVLRCAVKAADFVLYQPGDFTKVRCKRVTVIGEWKE
jgi:hypothetical protein